MPSLEPTTELAVYRIAQESLTNTARHTDLGIAQLSLTTADDRVVLSVRDAGGTGPAAGGPNGTGLPGMRERAVLVGADLTINPRAGGGTEVTLSVPTAGNAP